MLGFNAEFQNGTTRVSKVWLDFTLLDGTPLSLNESRVMMNGFSRDTSTSVDGEFTVGAAVTGKLSLVINNADDALSLYDFRGAVVVASIGGILSGGTVEKVNVGRYYVDEYHYDGSNINLVAYDDMCQFDVPCKDTNYNWGSGKTIPQLIASAIGVANLSGANLALWNSNLPGPDDYTVTKQPAQWDSMTWHDVISYCAQVMCCYAHIVYVPSPGQYKLKFEWYDPGVLAETMYNGGTLNTTTTPYSDGDSLDGGTFNPWNTGDVADAGLFEDRTNTHVIGAPYNLTVDTDDVLITGVTATLEPTDNIQATDDTETYTTPIYGTAGYVIEISGNPLIETTGQADDVAEYIATYINGMHFRPLNASVVENPAIEAGDTAFVQGRKNALYPCFISNCVYTIAAATRISCDAASSMQNLKGRYSGAQKTQALANRIFERSFSNTEQAMQSILGAYAASMGLYDISYEAQGGGTILQFGDQPTQSASTIIWRLSAGALIISTDGGQSWNGALSVDGTAVLQRLYAIGIEAQEMTVTNGYDTVFHADSNSGDVSIGGFSVEQDTIRYGQTSLDAVTEGVYISPSGISVGEFKVYPAMYTRDDRLVGRVKLGNILTEYTWDETYTSDPGSLFIDNMATLDMHVIEGIDIYINEDSSISSFGFYQVNIQDGLTVLSLSRDINVSADRDIHIDAGRNIYITANSGNGTIYFSGYESHAEPD